MPPTSQRFAFADRPFAFVIVHRLAAEVVRAIKDAKFAQQLNDRGAEPIGSSPEKFAAMISADIELWTNAVKIAGVKTAWA